jgi:alkylation response protein AidB-like acyl-CoA dehydrogenase
MVNTFLSATDQTAKEQFEQFAQDKLLPLVTKLSNDEEQASSFLTLMAQAGYLALNVPQAQGGKNSPFLHIVLLAEALAHYDAGMAVYLAYHAGLVELLKSYGSEKQKADYLPKLASGQFLGTLAYFNLSQTKQEANLQTVSEDLILDGVKQLVVSTLSNVKNSAPRKEIPNLVAVLADEKLFLVDDLSASNIEIEVRRNAGGFKSLSFIDIIFQKYKISNHNLIADKTATTEAVSFARDILKTILAAAALGMADSALNQMTKHVQASESSAKPLSQSQAILWKLANASTDTSAARLLIYRAAWSKDEDKEMFSKYAAMAKTYATQTARIHTGESLQILLPLLQMEYSDLANFYTDSKILETFDATNEEEKVLLSTLLGI